MKVNIQNISEGIYENSEELSSEEIELSEPVDFIGKLLVNVFVDNFEDSYRIKIGIKTELKQQCDRCLENYKSMFDATGEQIYQIGTGDYEDDDIEILPKNTKEIDLNNLINEVFLINRPIQNTCNDDCRGLCADCGKNLNKTTCNCKQESIDPRLEKLKTLIK